MYSLSIFPKLLLVTLVGSFLYACEVKVSTSGGAKVQPSETVKESPVSSSSPNTDKGSPKDAGSTKASSDDKQGDIAAANEAIRLNPNDATAYLVRGMAKANLGDNQVAITDLNEGIRLNPNLADAAVYLIRGGAKSELGDKQGAIADMRKAADLFKQSSNTELYNDAIAFIEKLSK